MTTAPFAAPPRRLQETTLADRQDRLHNVGPGA